MSKMTPYQRIMRASKIGRGVRLSAKECWQLSFDDAIATRAVNDDLGEVYRLETEPPAEETRQGREQ